MCRALYTRTRRESKYTERPHGADVIRRDSRATVRRHARFFFVTLCIIFETSREGRRGPKSVIGFLLAGMIRRGPWTEQYLTSSMGGASDLPKVAGTCTQSAARALPCARGGHQKGVDRPVLTVSLSLSRLHPPSNGEVCPRLRILPFLFCSTTQGFLLFYLSLDSPSQVPLLLRYSDSLPRLSHLGPAFSFLILHSRFLRFLSDSLGQPEPIPDSAPPSRFSCLSSYS